MNMRFTRIYLLLACSALIPACAIPGDSPWSDLHVNVDAAGFNPTFEASAGKIARTGIDGSFSINSKEEYTDLYGARFGFAPFEFSVSQFSYSRNQTGVFNGTFGGIPLSAGTPVDSSLELAATKMMVGIDVLNTSIARVGILAGFDLLSFNKLSLTNAGIVQNVLVNQEVPIPIIGLRGDIAIPGTSISLGAEISGISIDVDDLEASFFDHNINLSMEIVKNAEVVVGYRTISLNIDGDIDNTQIQNMDLSMSGPYFGVSVYF
ncbi:hypothetical protein OAR23_00725 [bacterium]|nr:hypothetical protein [bacterium]